MTGKYRDQILKIIGSLPEHVVSAAAIAEVIVTMSPAHVREWAQYQHITRNLYVQPRLGPGLLKRSVVHEIAHALDDNFGVGHYFGESPHWVTLSNRLYGPEASPVETFADAMSDYLLDPVRVRASLPTVAVFLAKVLDYLKKSASIQ